MEKNLTYASGAIRRVRIKLTWAQVDIVPTKTEEFQLIIAGDDDSIDELRLEQTGEDITVAQPQYVGYARDIPRRRWLQVCLRVPESWHGDVDVDTVTGTVSVSGLDVGDASITTVSGPMRVRDTSGKLLWMHTVSGGIAGSSLRADRANLRSVSGAIAVSDCTFRATKAFTISGEVSLSLLEGCRTVDMQSVSGSLSVEADGPVKAALHSLSGQFVMEGDIQQEEGGLEINASSVSGDLAMKRREIK